MREGKKAASDVAASKSGGENKTICQSSISEDYSITAAEDGQGRFASLLPHESAKMEVDSGTENEW